MFFFPPDQVENGICNAQNQEQLQGVRQILPDPFICIGFHSLFFSVVSKRDERESCSLIRNECTVPFVNSSNPAVIR